MNNPVVIEGHSCAPMTRVLLIMVSVAVFSSATHADRAFPPPRKLEPEESLSLSKRFEGVIDTLTNPPHDNPPVALQDHQPLPAYPDLAKTRCSNIISGSREDGPAGTVRYYIFVDENGYVSRWQRIDEEPPGMGFGDEADRVIGRWRFRSAQDQERPVGVWTTIAVQTREWHLIIK